VLTSTQTPWRKIHLLKSIRDLACVAHPNDPRALLETCIRHVLPFACHPHAAHPTPQQAAQRRAELALLPQWEALQRELLEEGGASAEASEALEGLLASLRGAKLAQVQGEQVVAEEDAVGDGASDTVGDMMGA